MVSSTPSPLGRRTASRIPPGRCIWKVGVIDLFFLLGASEPSRKFFGTTCGPFGVLSCLRIVQADVESFSEGF